jgi:GTP cyclohydrolase II
MTGSRLADTCCELSCQQTASVRNIVTIPIKDGLYQGEFISFHDLVDDQEHFAIGFGDWRKKKNPLVRVHSECITGDTFYSTRCDCGKQLDEAIERTAKEGGLILYLRQEGRGIGLYNKIDAYDLQAQGFNTYEANRKLNLPDDMRNYLCAAQMLNAMGITSIRLLSNNPKKTLELEAHGIKVVKTEKTGVFMTKENYFYLLAKSHITSHDITLEGFER